VKVVGVFVRFHCAASEVVARHLTSPPRLPLSHLHERRLHAESTTVSLSPRTSLDVNAPFSSESSSVDTSI
jgi:hypothetical protein